jgi:aminopeptidase N
MGDSAASQLYQRFRISGWARSMDVAQDLPIITPADAIAGSAYGINAYGKPSLGYLALKDMLGDDLFRKCLHAYMERWNGKHPTPWDFFYTFDNVAGRPLDWFWTNWFFSTNYIDLAVKSVTKSRDGYTVTVDNVGGMDAPFDLAVTLADGTTQRLHQTSAVWEKNSAQAVIPVRTKSAVKSVEIENGIWMDANRDDNGWKGK